jgi:hypothetical protein
MPVDLGSLAGWLGTSNPLTVAAGLVALYLCAQLTTLAHELGHAAVGLRRTDGLVVVKLGYAPTWRHRVGRLELVLTPGAPRENMRGFALVYARLEHATQIALVLAGPLAGATVGLVVLELGRLAHVHWLVFAGLLNVGCSLLNLVPFEHRGVRSDGAWILETLGRRPTSGQRSTAFDGRDGETRSRWLVRFTDPRTPASMEDSRRLWGAALALGHRPGDQGGTAAPLWQFALAGWCWREAEQGERNAIREMVLDARLRASRQPTRTGIAVAAALELARDVAALRLASPTEASLDEGLRIAGERIKLLPSAEHTAFAFHFGVALNDVERIAG